MNSNGEDILQLVVQAIQYGHTSSSGTVHQEAKSERRQLVISLAEAMNCSYDLADRYLKERRL